MVHTVALVGTGADPDTQDRHGYAMAYRHADAYEQLEGCEIVACADLVRENAAAFADTYGIDDDRVFEDYEVMLDAAEPDVVSVCTPPAVHEEIVVDCARHDAVAAIHCEKPMADTWGAARNMAAVADEESVRLTFNHQRRFGTAFREAKALLDAGEIGELERVEVGAMNLYDYGTHSIDLANYFLDQSPPEWVLGQVDYAEENRYFGAPNDTHGLACWGYENGVHGLATTGEGVSDAVGVHHRLVGTGGTIELRNEDRDPLYVRRDGEGFERVDCDGESLHGPGFIERAIRDVIDALDAGEESELRAANALQATEVIFGTYESARRRGRVEFPLEVEDNPLTAMIEAGAFEDR